MRGTAVVALALLLAALELRAADSLTRSSSTLRVGCSQDVDEQEANPAGRVDTKGRDIDFGMDAPDGNQAFGSQLVGLTFQLSVPQGAVITAASVQLVAAKTEETNAAGANILWRANAADNATSIPDTADTGISFGVSGRARTSASMTWGNVPSFVEGDTFATPDMSNVVQEVVNRPGWVPGNMIMLIATTNANGGTFHRAAATRNADNNKKAVLSVTFSLATVAPPPTPLPTPLASTSSPTDVATGGPVAAPVVAAGSGVNTGSLVGGLFGVLAFASVTAFFLTRRKAGLEEHTVVPSDGAGKTKGVGSPTLSALGWRHTPSFVLQTGAPTGKPRLSNLGASYRLTFQSSMSGGTASIASLGPAAGSPQGPAEGSPRGPGLARGSRGTSFNDGSNALVLDGRVRGSTLGSGISSPRSVGYLP
jgi:hypothetical protein